jgi:hypothetical protein
MDNDIWLGRRRRESEPFDKSAAIFLGVAAVMAISWAVFLSGLLIWSIR